MHANKQDVSGNRGLLDENDILDDSPMFAEFVPRFLALCESAAGRRAANSDDELAHKRGIIEHHLEPFFGRCS